MTMTVDIASSSSTSNMARTLPLPGPKILTAFTSPPSQQQEENGSSTSPDDDNASSPRSDGAEDDEFEGDQDDAQSFMQPAISPLATFLTSPRTPAAERVAALDRLPGGGIFEVLDDDTAGHMSLNGSLADRFSRHLTEPAITTDAGRASGCQLTDVRMPTPWQAGPRQFQVSGEAPETGKFRSSMSMSMAIKGQSRHKRASSVGENALKRLSKALPSISIPSSLMASLPTPPFFSSHSISSSSSSPQKEERLTQPKTPLTAFNRVSSPQIPRSGSPKPGSLRRTTSEDSMLYHTLSRVSSLGDDGRFANVREQVNVRMKAIMDSFDGPSFKMPSILNTAPKKSVTEPIMGATRSGSIHYGGQPPKDPLDSVLESLTGDIVIMGGYRGSILRSSKAPYRRQWVPVKVQLGVRKVNLEVGLDPEDEENMEKHIFADGMLQNIGPVDISRRLFKKLRECENYRLGKLRVHDYGYDWRLSPHLLSRKLVEFLEKLPSNHPATPKEERGVLVISHSLGGLITRHAVNQRPELFSGVVYVGVPQRCINVLGPVRNGDAVLLNEKILSAQVNFSLRTTFVFFPEDGFCFIDKHTNEEYRVNFYDVNDWIKYRWSPCVAEPALPALSRNSTFGSLLSLSDSLPSLPLRSRSNTQSKRSSAVLLDAVTKDRTIAPQINSFSSAATTNEATFPSSSTSSSNRSSSVPTTTDAQRARNLAYLARTLAETKKFRAELAHNKSYQEANAYPPLGLIYAKDIPTTYACRVAGREGIACADAYDDLVFRSGDGVVLAREAMLPEGYEVVRGGRVVTDRGHIGMLGDLVAVGKAMEAVVRGRRKGIGMGVKKGK
ncbi:hypothetical protein QBC38DRAFT_257563 [Podospora fimiseda]|uniref:Phosphatidylcholine-sterol O-acyltransferase n=1 Tax=Podospora fimiseda TaxID=252190 RepID=A0AAN7BL97_9PEZI|nr:hypothetical protein QBC38DRAFT_257563 [Podospora fimiseda]